MKKATVIKPFRDKNDHKTIYNVGQVLENFGDDRITDLEKRGFVTVEIITVIFGAIDLTKPARDIEVAVSETSDIDLLSEALQAEANGKGRAGVQKSIDARIQELQAIEDKAIEEIGKNEDIKNLKESLQTEKAAEQPRQRIVEAIRDRIVELAE